MEEHCNALDQIVKKIKSDGPPAFIKSAQRITQLTENNETDIKELCSVIIKDPGMATRILRASNQSFNVRRGRSNIEFFIAPIILEDNFIACFYGDRGISKRALNQDIFNTFSQLALQGQFAMERKG